MLFTPFLNGQVFSQIQDESISRYWDGELINGVCWAKSNVDKPGTFASTPEAYGMYYQWNRKKGLSAADSDWDDNLPSEFVGSRSMILVLWVGGCLPQMSWKYCWMIRR